MAEPIETLKRSEITQQPTDPKLAKLDATIAENPPANAVATARPKQVRNFEKDVHSWNTTLPMWRRSNKE